jgi:hypothetical protein
MIAEEKILVSLQKFVDSVDTERIRVLIVPYTENRRKMGDGTKNTMDIITIVHS